MKKHLAGLAGALAVVGLVAPSTPASAAPASAPPASADPGPAAKGAAWMAEQVPASGIFSISYEYQGEQGTYDDVGLTIDGAQSLDELGVQPAVEERLTDAVLAAADGYVTQYGTTYANSAAKAAAFLLDQGRTGAEVDDVVATLVSTVSTSGPTEGRIGDIGSDDFATPLGQAYAVQALALADEPELAAARAFLLEQQCAAGYFRAGFTSDKTAEDQSCAGAPSGEQGSSVDTTAFAILALQDLAASDTDLASALDEAAAWLADVQGEDGSFSTGGTSGAVNANSTGLAARALGAEGLDADAARAALWLRAHQLNNAGGCAPFAAADDGALVVDDLGLANAGGGAFDDIDRSVALRATAQALPGIAYAPGGPARAGRTVLTAETQPVRAGTRRTVRVASAPGNTLCIRVGSGSYRTLVVPADGRTSFVAQLPGGTRRTPITTVDASGRSARAEIVGLAARRLSVRATSAVRRGGSAVVIVRGLVRGERVAVRFRGRVVATGRAGADRRFDTRFVVRGATGRVPVVATGQFADRRGQTSITVR